MSVYGSYPGDLIASVSVVLDGTTFGDPLRVASTALTAPGIYTITLGEPVAFAFSTVSVSARAATAVIVVFARNSTTEIIVRTFDTAGAPVNANFDLQVFRTQSA